MPNHLHDSKRDVFLLGAGFSRAVDDAMPMMNGLTQGIRERLSSSIGIRSLDETPFLNDNFELALSYLADSLPWISEADRLRNRALFLDVSEAIHGTLVAAQDSVLRSRPECPDWLSQLVCWMHLNRAVVITLNYDMLLEMALSDLYFGKGRHFSSYYLRPFDFPAIEGLARGPSPDTLRLLKLHGSLHWTYSGSERFFGEAIQDARVLRWSDPNKTHTAYKPESGRVPLIVPPTLNKSRYFENEKIRSVWRQAAEALTNARRVFCIGYSLPAGDLLMRFLLSSAKPDSASIPFYLVNPDPDAPTHYQAALPPWLSQDMSLSFACAKDYTVSERFARALMAGELDSATCNSCTGWEETELVRLFRAKCPEGSTQFNQANSTQFMVRRLDRFGIYMESTRDGGSIYVPWPSVAWFLSDHGVNGRRDWVMDTPRGTFPSIASHEQDQQVVSLLRTIGAFSGQVDGQGYMVYDTLGDLAAELDRFGPWDESEHA